MIKLDIKEYCNNCPHFDPEVEVESVNYKNNLSFEYVYKNETIVRCKDRCRCAAIYEYLQKPDELTIEKSCGNCYLRLCCPKNHITNGINYCDMWGLKND